MLLLIRMKYINLSLDNDDMLHSIDSSNKEKIAIVAVGYNRLASIQRLLGSLIRAYYPSNDIPLVISIDCSHDNVLYDYVSNFKWPFGEKFVNIQTERIGLREHIIQCGDLTQYFKAVILLEDDIFVSEYFYKYTESAVAYYGQDDRISCISLYKNERYDPYNLPLVSMHDGSDAFLIQSIASWGECWTEQMWNGFKYWYNKFNDDFSDIDMQPFAKKWEKAWSKYYMAYNVENNKFCLFPCVSHTTCFSDIGEHNSESSSIGQANLLMGQKDYVFRPFEEMVKYDIYFNNYDIYKWLDLTPEQLCVSIEGNNPNLKEARYILSAMQLPYKIVKSFAIVMRPIELNVKYDIPGNGLYLYDTTEIVKKKNGESISLSLLQYYFRGIYCKLLIRYCIDHYITAIKKHFNTL